MNYWMIINIIAKIVGVEAAFMLPALIISAVKGENRSAVAFAATIALMLIMSLPLALMKKRRSDFHAREGLVTVGLAWIVVSLFGALPFCISGAIPNYIDCIFETVSGFTTTGATILGEIESLPMGILYWRSFTHWLGGMGVLVFVLALSPLTEKDGGEGMHLLRAESPGIKISKLVPRMKRSAGILYTIYVVMTVLEAVLLIIGRVPLFDSVTIAFGTAGTGGFAIKNDSLASYSAYTQWVVTVFMLLFSVNFNIYFLLLLRQFRKVIRDEELRAFSFIVVGTTVIIAINTIGCFDSFGENIRHSAFQVASIISTTGFCTVDFDQWPQISRTLLVLLMFIGACAGSTGGGSKVVRVVVLLRSAKRAIYKAFHPRAVKMVYMDGEILEDDTVNAVGSYYLIYFLIFAITTLLITVDGFSMETNFTAVAACINNVGPGMDGVGAVMNYGAFSYFSKIILSISMLIGRLEIYPILVLMVPQVWKK
ncbi:MAG: TrkH family potassium uptake protein [Ruminococcaceae bacterium]|nr:TrkH family potassium uptake protein [Oscillospiraceae bacterium]